MFEDDLNDDDAKFEDDISSLKKLINEFNNASGTDQKLVLLN